MIKVEGQLGQLPAFRFHGNEEVEISTHGFVKNAASDDPNWNVAAQLDFGKPCGCIVQEYCS
jgi:hypothetical protein